MPQAPSEPVQPMMPQAPSEPVKTATIEDYTIGSDELFSNAGEQNLQQFETNKQVSTQTPENTDINNSMDVMNNLNKQEAMEEALSRTNKYSPFEAPVSEIVEEEKQEDKNILVFVIILAVIMSLFIFFLPQISNLLGW